MSHRINDQQHHRMHRIDLASTKHPRNYMTQTHSIQMPVKLENIVMARSKSFKKMHQPKVLVPTQIDTQLSLKNLPLMGQSLKTGKTKSKSKSSKIVVTD